jgi:hypothetical protein
MGSFSNKVSTILEAAALWGDDILAKVIKEMMLHGPKKAIRRFNIMQMQEHVECLEYLLKNKNNSLT